MQRLLSVTSVATCLIAFAGSACAQAPQTIRMAVVKATILGPSLAVQKHLPAGWKTEITYFTSPSDMMTALLTDSVDVAYIGFTIGVVSRSKDLPIVVIANQAGKGTAIVARADSGIRSIADLKGKRFGNLPNSIHDILLREELRKAGLKIDDITAIRLVPADMPAALQRGDIDAFSASEPFATAAMLAGYGRLLMYPYDNPVGTINVGVLSSERQVAQKANMLRVWGAAHARATDELAGNPDLWADMVNKEWGFDRAVARRSIDNIELKWRMDERFDAQLAIFAERLKALGVVSTVPDLKKLVVRDFVGR